MGRGGGGAGAGCCAVELCRWLSVELDDWLGFLGPLLIWDSSGGWSSVSLAPSLDVDTQ